MTGGGRAAVLLRLLMGLLPLVVALAVVPLALAETAAPVLHGLAPLSGDQRVPRKLLPPGAFDDDDGPSDVVFPMQHVTLRFNHAKHMGKPIQSTCKTCHGAAYRSASAQDLLLPKGTTCDACHSTDHDNLAAVQPGDDEKGQCAFCHLGYKAADGNRVAQLSAPRANLVFNHKLHVDRNIGCAQCHGAVDQLELATRDQLPRMRGCFGCHEMPDSASRGEAKSACDTCHPRGDSTSGPTRIRTMFASGTLMPPRWLHNAQHTPDFLDRHKYVAADDSQFCANCHTEDYCADCHDGRVRPRSIHPNDYLNMHAIDARMEPQKCESCHHETSFCLGCHMRVGVAEASPTSDRDHARFHPPKSIWSDPPMKMGSHGFEAERNLNACVSCHTERDCVVCHGALGVGGGFDPHKGGFRGGCATQLRRNPRPCYVCHEPRDPNLGMCQ
jgi:hypothetical protein